MRTLREMTDRIGAYVIEMIPSEKTWLWFWTILFLDFLHLRFIKFQFFIVKKFYLFLEFFVYIIKCQPATMIKSENNYFNQN